LRFTERARVVSVEGGRTEVALPRPEVSETCRRCPAAAICRREETRRILIAEAPDWVREGSDVMLEISGTSPAQAAALLFLLPMVVAFGSALGVYFLSRVGAAALVSGGLGAGGTYLVLWTFRNRWEVRAKIVGPAA